MVLAQTVTASLVIALLPHLVDMDRCVSYLITLYHIYVYVSQPHNLSASYTHIAHSQQCTCVVYCTCISCQILQDFSRVLAARMRYLVLLFLSDFGPIAIGDTLTSK